MLEDDLMAAQLAQTVIDDTERRFKLWIGKPAADLYEDFLKREQQLRQAIQIAFVSTNPDPAFVEACRVVEKTFTQIACEALSWRKARIEFAHKGDFLGALTFPI